MSAGSTLLTPHSHFELVGSASAIMDSNGNANGSSAFSDEDLIASLSGFAVEGQTERDLATIKAMLLQNGGLDSHHHHASSGLAGNHQHTNHQHIHHNSFSSNAGGFWPQQPQPINTTSTWQSYAWGNSPLAAQLQTGQPPPNTPTLSKSLDLYGSSAGGSSNEYSPYFGNNGLHAYASPASNSAFLPGTSGRRRDVSLERPGLAAPHLGTSRTRSFRASSTSTSGEGCDMDMGDDSASEQPTASSSNGFRPHASSMGVVANNDAGIMEDIEEDSMREEAEQDTQAQYLNQFQQQTSATTIPSPLSGAAASNDNRPSSGAAETYATRQTRSRTGTPNGTISLPPSRPLSVASGSMPGSPPQTRARVRMQQQAMVAPTNSRA